MVEAVFEARLPASAAGDVELFVFGDLHGHRDLLSELLDAAAGMPRLAARREVVFLGDLIDRGPDGLGVVGLAMGAGAALGADALVTLAGNHDGMLQATLDASLGAWSRDFALRTLLRNGGRGTIDQARAAHPGVDPEEACRRAYGTWLDGLRSHHRSGGLTMVHAGLHPGIAPDEFLSSTSSDFYDRLGMREEAHWSWVRGPFLDHEPAPGEGHHGWFVLHGHSIPGAGDERCADAGAVARWRLNLDAGSYRTGRARMAVVRGDGATVHEARR